ncbi:LysM peptidoglycan-binding domain-containing protein [Agromyces sp. SYSU T00266]|uniref:LysM peptidoglycan-binding domain-containing protein n=1 Tax=Agromyces zhanjiangensis TaxID=3158562 RepID=UPI00339610B3
MRQHPGDSPTGDVTGAGDRAPAYRRVGVRRLLTVPVAVVGAVAVILGIVQPAEAAPQSVKRQPKAKEARGTPTPRQAAPASAAIPQEVVVAQGDTVSAIAERFGLSTAEVLAENGLSWSSLIFPGQRLALPGGTPNAAATQDTGIARHIVAPGDTMIAIAAEYGLDVEVVLSANGLGRASLIFPGQAITIPGGVRTAASADSTSAPDPAPTPEQAHVVAEGDTLIGIGERYGVGLDRLLELNGLTASSIIVPDQRIVVRGAVVEASTVAALDVRLDDEMRANARVIVDVGRSLGIPDRGIVIALAAAAQESGLRNVRHGDRDSLGLFQQRPSQGWGTPEQVLDPVRAATAFYGGPSTPNEGRTPGLLDIAGWADLSVTDAAQAVQRSAHPEHYAKWEASARRWLDELG